MGQLFSSVIENQHDFNLHLSAAGMCLPFVFLMICFITDYAMPLDTVIVGDERGCFIYRNGNGFSSTPVRPGFVNAVALVFAQDRDRSSGTFHYLFGSSCRLMHNIIHTSVLQCMPSYFIDVECDYLYSSKDLIVDHSCIFLLCKYLIFHGTNCVVNQIIFRKKNKWEIPSS